MPKTGKIIQNTFSGGMNQTSDPSKAKDNEYTLLFNGRIRNDTIAPINKHKDITVGLPSGGNLQGIYGTDNLLLAFVDGKAYYRDLTPDNDSGMFARLITFSPMDANVENIFVELVPASTINYQRSLDDTENKNSMVWLTTPIKKSPACAVVQDGINQPRLIFPTGDSRISKDYNGWTMEDREYVPIGKQMALIDNILYIVEPNGKFFYRSVSGRPIDFMVSVKSNGDKELAEEDGGAALVSHAVSYYSITDIKRLNSFNRGFLVTTNRSSHIISPDYTATVFGEPLFKNADLFDTGSLNPFSVTDIGGDVALIDGYSIRSFNAMESTSFEGKNSPFYKKIDNLFEYGPNNPVIQSKTAAINYDNYGLFGVNTVYGPSILVYDLIKDNPNEDLWASLDLLDPDTEGYVKQFCEIKVERIRKLFFATDKGKIFEAWGSPEKAPCKFYTREFTSNDPEIENIPLVVKLVFLNVEETGTVYVTPFVDGLEGRRLSKIVKGTGIKSIETGIITDLPFGEKQSKDNVKNVTFTWTTVRQGWKMGFFIEWDFQAELSHVLLLTKQSQMITSIEQE